MGNTKVQELSGPAIDSLNLSPDVSRALKDVQAELADAYREGFLAMVEAINTQASAIKRIQASLDLLIRHTKPELADQLPAVVPAVVRIARDGEEPDLASALVVADPIGAGYTLSATAFSKVLGISTGDFSILAKAFKLSSDGNCAVVVRKGGTHHTIVNYHPRAVQRVRELIATPPPGLTSDQKSALRRVVKRMLVATPESAPPPQAPNVDE